MTYLRREAGFVKSRHGQQSSLDISIAPNLSYMSWHMYTRICEVCTMMSRAKEDGVADMSEEQAGRPRPILRRREARVFDSLTLLS